MPMDDPEPGDSTGRAASPSGGDLRRGTAVLADIVIHDDRWHALQRAEAIAGRAVKAAAGAAPNSGGEIAVVLTSDAKIQTLNAQYRGKDRPANVLSFPSNPAGWPAGMEPRPLGDVVIAYETMMREAEAEGKAPEHHFAHLVVHGVLHLLGFDHQTDAAADAMEACERRVLAGLGIADPYAAAQSPKHGRIPCPLMAEGQGGWNEGRGDT